MEIGNWPQRDVAGEHVLARSESGVTMVFGLGPPAPGDPAEERCRRLLRSAEPPLRAVRWARQVHGSTVTVVSEEAGSPLAGARCAGTGDALVTAELGVAVLVWTADCVPILFEGGGVVAAVHSGWRGTSKDIVGEVVRTFETTYGVSPTRLRAALGPAISGPRYEVGAEVVNALRQVDPAGGGWLQARHVDLRTLIARRLHGLGMAHQRICLVGPCTACSPRLASYRRDGAAAGRQFSFVYRSEGPPDRRPLS